MGRYVFIKRSRWGTSKCDNYISWITWDDKETHVNQSCVWKTAGAKQSSWSSVRSNLYLSINSIESDWNYLFQLKLWYHNQEQELLVTIVSASELPLVDGNQPPQAFSKVYMLPDARYLNIPHLLCFWSYPLLYGVCVILLRYDVCSDNSRRVTRTVPRTREPEWRQTFSYRPLSRQQMMEKSIEVTVWNLKKSGQAEFLGEVHICITV